VGLRLATLWPRLKEAWPRLGEPDAGRKTAQVSRLLGLLCQEGCDG
jgi:hypothetical protein